MRAALVVFLLLITLPTRAATPEGELARAEGIVKVRCSLCHGMKGESVSTQYPKLAGQHQEYLLKQLFNYKTGQRPSTVMQQMTNDLSATEINLLARYFSMQAPAADAFEDAELAAVGRYVYFRGNRWAAVSACVICHGVYATGGAQLPRLAGQHASYLEARMLEARQPERRDLLAAMHSAVAALSVLEIKAVAQYLSGQE